MTRFSDKIIFSHTTYLRLAQQWSWFANYLRIFAMSEKNLNVWLTTSKKERWYPIYPEIPGNTQEYPEIPESKKDTRKYPLVYFNTPTRPEPDPLPGIFSNTRPDPILKNPTRWALIESLDKQVKSMIIFSDNADPYKGQGRARLCKVCGKEGIWNQ